MSVVLDSLTPYEAESWSMVFAQTRRSWRAAYSGTITASVSLPDALEGLQDDHTKRPVAQILA